MLLGGVLFTGQFGVSDTQRILTPFDTVEFFKTGFLFSPDAVNLGCKSALLVLCLVGRLARGFKIILKATEDIVIVI